jgi:hypothetical protein
MRVRPGARPADRNTLKDQSDESPLPLHNEADLREFKRKWPGDLEARVTKAITQDRSAVSSAKAKLRPEPEWWAEARRIRSEVTSSDRAEIIRTVAARIHANSDAGKWPWEILPCEKTVGRVLFPKQLKK